MHQPTTPPRTARPVQLRWQSLPLFAVSLLVGGAALRAQVAPPDLAPARRDDLVLMNPFTVESTGDHGYQAQATLGGSRLKTDLKDVGSPTTAFTEQFLKDVAVTNTDDLARYMLSTEYDFEEDGGNQNSLYNTKKPLRMRGLPGGTISVNFFKSDLPMDTFNTERMDQSRGPNSVLFGIGSPGGIINVTTKRALLGKRSAEVGITGRSQNGLREEVDFNEPVIQGKVAVRVAAVNDNQGSWRNHEFNDGARSFIAGRWRIDHRTELNVDAENGDINKQLKRTFTAYDGYTQWKAAGSNLSATPNAALYVSRIANNNVPWIVYDTATGTLTNWVNKTQSTQRLAVTGENVALSDFSVLPKETAIYGPGFDQRTRYSRLGAYFTHAFTDDLNLELAGMRTDSHVHVWDSQLVATQVLKADTNPTLPSGAPNPNAGRAYLEAGPQANNTEQRNDSLRAILSYKKDLGRWGTHTLAGVYEYDFSKTSQAVLREQIISANAPVLTDPANNNNRVWRRTYVNLNGPSNDIVMANFLTQSTNGLTETLSGKTYQTAFIPFNANTQLNSNDGRTAIGMLQSAFWHDRIQTIIGGSEDKRNDYLSTQVFTPLPGFTGASGGIRTPVRSHTPNSVNAHSVSFSGVFHVNDWLSLTYSKAANSALPQYFGRINTVSTDPTSFSRPPVPHGKSQDVGLKLDVWQHKVFLTASYFHTSVKQDFLGQTLSTSTNLIWNALVAANVVPTTYANADLSTGTTVDTETKGYELEMTANPTEHWRIFLNYSDSKTEHANGGRESMAYIAAWRPLWEKNSAVPLGTQPGTVGSQLTALDALVFNNFTLADHSRPLGQIQHKLNLVTNYDFTADALKGFSVGGGIRYSSAPVIGFTASGTPDAIARTVYYGSKQVFVDANAGYRRNLHVMGRRIGWSLQLNVNNVFNNDAFVRIRQTSDGLLVNYRFNPPLQWIVTSRFSF